MGAATDFDPRRTWTATAAASTTVSLLKFDWPELEAYLIQRIGEPQTRAIFAKIEQASRDPLTGLHNRRHLVERFELMLGEAERTGGRIAVALFDVDKFKSVNDEYGHPAGDQVLRVISERMRKAVRPNDTVGRYGGEEFVVVLPGCDAVFGRTAAERLRAAVAARPVDSAGSPIAITCSVGVAAAGGAVGWSAEALVGAADAALYEAKGAGRDRVVVSAARAPVAGGGAPPSRP